MRARIAGLLLVGIFAAGINSPVFAQASKKLAEVTKRMESPQQKMQHADKIMREQDKTSSKRAVVDKRAAPNARPWYRNRASRNVSASGSTATAW